MRALRLTGLVFVLVAGLCSTSATSGTVPDLPVSELFTPPGKLTPLRAGVAYQATAFPIALRFTPPDGSWGGAQWKANRFGQYEIEKRHLTCSSTPAVCKGPYYGWVAIGQGGLSRSNVPPHDLILVLSSFTRTPSVAWTVKSLRTRGHGATYEPAKPVKVAGFSGIEFDGRVVGPKHVFVPFTPPTSKGGGDADAIEMDGSGHGFRFIVLGVRGKTVVVFISSLMMTADQFAAFVPKTDAIVSSLRFPG